MRKEIVEALDSIASELFGNTVWQDLKSYIKITYGIDLTLPEDVTQKADLFERIIYEFLGPFAAPVLLEQINDKLIKHFLFEDSENFAYSSIGDYGKLIKQLIVIKINEGEST